MKIYFTPHIQIWSQLAVVTGPPNHYKYIICDRMQCISILSFESTVRDLIFPPIGWDSALSAADGKLSHMWRKFRKRHSGKPSLTLLVRKVPPLLLSFLETWNRNVVVIPTVCIGMCPKSWKLQCWMSARSNMHQLWDTKLKVYFSETSVLKICFRECWSLVQERSTCRAECK